MSKRKRKNWTRVYNVLDSECVSTDLSGFWFVFDPQSDPIAWDALEYYASITPNGAQAQAIYDWLGEHPRPEQTEMGL